MLALVSPRNVMPAMTKSRATASQTLNQRLVSWSVAVTEMGGRVRNMRNGSSE